LVSTVKNDPFALFGFALRESDWVLADLLASRLADSDLAKLRLEQELDAAALRANSPENLRQLRGLAKLTRDLDLEDVPG
jgi:hypothetical protein